MIFTVFCAKTASAASFAYLADPAGKTISVLDRETRTVTAIIPLDAIPATVLISPDRTTAYVALRDANAVQIIDLSRNELVEKPISLGRESGARGVQALAITPDGRRLFAAIQDSENGGSLVVIETVSQAVMTTIPVGPDSVAIALTPDGTKGWVVNRGDGTVTMIDADELTKTEPIAIGGSLEGIVITPDGRKGYVAESGQRQLVVLDLENRGAIVPLDLEGIPINLAMTPDGRWVYAITTDPHRLWIIDTENDTVVATLPLEGRPLSLAIPPEGGKVYVLVTDDETGARTLSIIDNETNTVTDQLPINGSPDTIAFRPPVPASVERLAYLTEPSHSRVSVLDPWTLDITNIPVGVLPTAVVVSPDSTRAYVTHQESPEISIVDPEKQLVTDILSLGEGAPLQSPTALTMAPDGRRIFAAIPDGEENGVVAVIDAVNQRLLATIPVGRDPVDLAMTPDGSQGWVVNRGNNSVTGINADDGTAIVTISVDDAPTAIAVAPDGERAYVVHEALNRVTVLDLAFVDAPLTDTIEIDMEATPRDLAITPEGQSVYVITTEPDGVSVISAENNEVAATILLPSHPISLGIPPDGRDVYVLMRNDETGERALAVIDISTNTMRATHPLDGDVTTIAFRPFVTPLPAGTLLLTTPGLGDVLSMGSLARICWRASDDVHHVKVLWKAMENGVKVAKEVLTKDAPQTGCVDWEVPSFEEIRLKIVGKAADEKKVAKVKTDTSRGDFAIVGPPVSAEMVRLTVAVEGDGVVRDSRVLMECRDECTADYLQQTILVLTATPANGFVFGGWQGACGHLDPVCKITMDESKNVTATFTVISIEEPPTPDDTADETTGGPADGSSGGGGDSGSSVGGGSSTSVISLGPAVSVPAGAFPNAVVMGDLNNDGALDLAVTNQDSERVSVLLNDGIGGFAITGTFTVGSFPSSIVMGDINNDGPLDLVVANKLSDSVSVLLGDGSGGFVTAGDGPVPAGGRPTVAALGNLNGDSKLDLVVTNQDSERVNVLVGDGSGDFVLSGTFSVGQVPVSIAIDDYNSDGNLDLAVANWNSEDLSILFGDGQGNFADAVAIPAGVGPISVAAGDLNSDGTPDLAVANRLSNDVSVLLNDGLGGFLAPNRFGAGSFPRAVALADLNGDGKLDLVVANEGSNVLPGDVVVLLGDGEGNLAVAAQFSFDTGASSVALGDVNGDGKIDVAASHLFSESVSVLVTQ